jgi:hypothetical protein
MGYCIILPVAPRNGAIAGLGIFRTFISAFTLDALAQTHTFVQMFIDLVTQDFEKNSEKLQ